MARVDTAGKDNKQETIVTYRRENDKTYTKITKHILRDLKTGITSSSKIKPVETGPYIVVKSGEAFDEKMSFLDIDGTERFMYFRKVEKQETQQLET